VGSVGIDDREEGSARDYGLTKIHRDIYIGIFTHEYSHPKIHQQTFTGG
jgi:hypothetical protein